MARSVVTTAALAAFALAVVFAGLWVRAAGQRDVAVAELDAAFERGKAQALAEHARRSQMIEDMLRVDMADLVLRFEGIAVRAQERVTVFRDRVVQAPAVECGPGQDFVDAVNEAIR